MKFRVGHEVRFEIIVEATNAKEAERAAEETPYERWDHRYITSEEVVPLEESPVNPQAE